MLSLNIAKTVVDIEGGGGPAVFHPYAYNGVFVHTAFLNEHPDTAHAIAAAMVEACQIINDPARMNDLMDVAANYMKGSDPAVVKAYLEKYRFELRADSDQEGRRKRQRHAARRQVDRKSEPRKGGTISSSSSRLQM